MAFPVVALALGGVIVGTEVAKADYQVRASEERERALDLEAKQMTLQTQQKTLANYDVMEKVLDAQAAHMTTTGAAFSSPSYNAIQRNVLNIGSRKEKNIEIESDLAEENIDIEKQNVKSALYNDLFGDVAQTAVSAASIYSKLPSKGA
jgi:hypothetical protein